MKDVPQELFYTSNHEWVRKEEDGTVTVGITEHAQGLLGDLVYVELPEVGRGVNGGEEISVVESVKAAEDIYSPLTGDVTEVNEALGDNPETINGDPYGDGWIFRLRPAADAEWDGLMDAGAYGELAESEEH